ncbi:hypothetical protein TZ00_17940 [Agreia bicolorata]|uniref:Uncharacterized protein n=1 Tax=Agreia bicolorata TaxID=110935 RepID=A0ABR5CB80_9MICO|nr:hypothetical protein TZ00_17940 [Agreia bicolorata]
MGTIQMRRTDLPIIQTGFLFPYCDSSDKKFVEVPLLQLSRCNGFVNSLFMARFYFKEFRHRPSRAVVFINHRVVGRAQEYQVFVAIDIVCVVCIMPRPVRALRPDMGLFSQDCTLRRQETRLRGPQIRCQALSTIRPRAPISSTSPKQFSRHYVD